MCDDDDNFVPVLLLDPSGVAVLGAEPLFQRLDRPSDLVRARPGLHQDQLFGLDHQLAVEASQPRDVGVDVVDQANLENRI